MANELANRMGVQPQNFLSYPYQLNYAPPLSQVAPVIPTEDKGFMGRMADRLFGAAPARVPFSQAYPSPQDVYYAQAYDQTYGTPMAGFTAPGAKVAQTSIDGVIGYGSDETLQNAKLQELSPEDRDAFLRNYIAAQKHPISAIGYDPRNITYTPKKGSVDLTKEGFYKPSKDAMWYYGKNQDSAVHESIHRGIQKLKDAGMLPESFSKSAMREETLTRLLMLKNFGDIEVQPNADLGNAQIDQARWWLKNYPYEANKITSELEAAAQEYIKKKNPKGPR